MKNRFIKGSALLLSVLCCVTAQAVDTVFSDFVDLGGFDNPAAVGSLSNK